MTKRDCCEQGSSHLQVQEEEKEEGGELGSVENSILSGKTHILALIESTRF